MACSILLLVAKMTNVLDDLLNYRGPRETITGYVLALVPGFLHFSLPLAGFMTGAICAARFRETHEFTAVWASGNSLRRVLRPVIFFLLLSVPAVYVFQDFLLPQANRYAAEHYRQLTGATEREISALIAPLSLQLPGISLHAPAFNFKALQTRHLIVNRRLHDGSHLHHVCNGFERHDDVIHLVDCKSYRIGADFKTGRYSEQKTVQVNHRALAEALSFYPQPADESGISGLAATLRYNALRGLKNHTVWTELFSRFAYCFVLPLAACLGLIAGLRFAHGGLALVIGVSLLFAALYYAALFALRALGNSGALPPALVAALPDIALCGFVWQGAKRAGI